MNLQSFEKVSSSIGSLKKKKKIDDSASHIQSVYKINDPSKTKDLLSQLRSYSRI